MKNVLFILAILVAPVTVQAEFPLACPAIVDPCDIRADWRGYPVPENDLQCDIPWGDMHRQCLYCQGLARNLAADHQAEQDLLTARITNLEIALQEATAKLAVTTRRNRIMRRSLASQR